MTASNKTGQHRLQSVAVIEEDQCIGCALCIKACPVDAIVGSRTFIHTVIAHECIGCKLCIAPCPVDCITMVSARITTPPTQTASVRRKRHTRRLSARAQQWATTTQVRREALKAAIRGKAAPGQTPAGRSG